MDIVLIDDKKTYLDSVFQAVDSDKGRVRTTCLREEQRFISKVDDCFSEEVRENVLRDVKEMKCVPNFLTVNRNIFRVSIIGDSKGLGIESSVVVFDSNCKLANKGILREYLEVKETPESVMDFTCDSLEKMASTGNWFSEEIPVTVFFLRYKLDSDIPEVVNLDWHQDVNSLSMTAVISPCKQDKGEFSGGELYFAESKKDLKVDFRIDDTEMTVLPDTIKKFSYPENGCFFFENLWSQHKVNDIQMISGTSCERVLFSVFANPDPAQLGSFLHSNAATNLV